MLKSNCLASEWKDESKAVTIGCCRNMTNSEAFRQLLLLAMYKWIIFQNDCYLDLTYEIKLFFIFYMGQF